MKLIIFHIFFALKLNLLIASSNTEFDHTFRCDPFISPKIVCDLSNMGRDFASRIIAINLMGATGSNRYFAGEIKSNPSLWITQEDGNKIYEYRYINQTNEGIYILHQRSKKKGSTYSQSILLVDLKKDYSLVFDTAIGENPNRAFTSDWGIDLTNFTTCHGSPERLLAINLCEIPLSDSWTGEINFKNGFLNISGLGKLQFESYARNKVLNWLEAIWGKIFSKNDLVNNSFASLIHERILQDFHTWVSDIGDQIVFIDLLKSQNHKEAIPIEETDFYPPFFHFWHLGQTKNNIHIVRIEEGTGGHSIFPNVMMISFEWDKGMSVDWERRLIRRNQKRLLVKKLGELQLPMNWWGSLEIEGNTLIIGDHEGVAAPLCYCRNQKTAAILEFKKQDERIFCITHPIRD